MGRRHEWAEDAAHRYGFYLEHPTDAGPYCVTKEGIGTTLVALRETGELAEGEPVGVLDGYGELNWIVNPFASQLRPKR